MNLLYGIRMTSFSRCGFTVISGRGGIARSPDSLLTTIGAVGIFAAFHGWLEWPVPLYGVVLVGDWVTGTALALKREDPVEHDKNCGINAIPLLPSAFPCWQTFCRGSTSTTYQVPICHLNMVLCSAWFFLFGILLWGWAALLKIILAWACRCQPF